MITLCFAGSSVPQDGAVTEIGFAEEKRCVYRRRGITCNHLHLGER
jgi:hypothetical protein